MTSIFCVLPEIVRFWPLADVVIYVLSPLRPNVLFAIFTLPVFTLPENARLTLFNWATLTASVSFVPAARPAS